MKQFIKKEILNMSCDNPFCASKINFSMDQLTNNLQFGFSLNSNPETTTILVGGKKFKFCPSCKKVYDLVRNSLFNDFHREKRANLYDKIKKEPITKQDKPVIPIDKKLVTPKELKPEKKESTPADQPATKKKEEYINAYKAAEFLGTSTGNLSNMRSRKVGPIYKKVGNAIVYSVSELAHFKTTFKPRKSPIKNK